MEDDVSENLLEICTWSSAEYWDLDDHTSDSLLSTTVPSYYSGLCLELCPHKGCYAQTFGQYARKMSDVQPLFQALLASFPAPLSQLFNVAHKMWKQTYWILEPKCLEGVEWTSEHYNCPFYLFTIAKNPWICIDFGCKFLADPKIVIHDRQDTTMLHVLLTKFHTVHTTNYPDFILDLCPYSFTIVVCLALDYSLCSMTFSTVELYSRLPIAPSVVH